MNSATSPSRCSAEFRLSPERSLGRVGQHQRERPGAGPAVGLVVQRLGTGKEREEIDDVVGGVVLHGHLVRGHGRVDGVAKELLQARHRNHSGFSVGGHHDPSLYRRAPASSVMPVTPWRRSISARKTESRLPGEFGDPALARVVVEAERHELAGPGQREAHDE